MARSVPVTARFTMDAFIFALSAVAPIIGMVAIGYFLGRTV